MLGASRWSFLLVVSVLAFGCGDDDDGRHGFDREAVLGALDDSAAMALCDLGEELREDAIADEEGRRSACFSQLIGDLQVGLINAEVSPQRSPLDTIVAECEAALERCTESGPKHRRCERIEFEASCRATVGDFERCLEATTDSRRALAAIDCDTFVRDEAERERVIDAASRGLESCGPVLACDSETTPDQPEPSWFDGGVGLSEPDAGPVDRASNEEWDGELQATVEALERPECDGVLVRDPNLDDAAAELTADTAGAPPELEARAEWKWISAPDLARILERIQAFLDDTGVACTWKRYGLAIRGEPGETRTVVLLLSE